MELTQLRQFKAVAESENLSKAAELLFVTQPALTHSIKKLEEELGCALFNREGKKITINADGRFALEYVNQILAKADEMKEKLNDRNKLGQVIFGSNIINLYQVVLPMCVAQLQNGISSYKIQVFNSEQILAALEEDRCDAIISQFPINDENYISIRLCRDYAGILVPKSDELALRTHIRLNDLRDIIFVTFTNENPLTVQTKDALKKAKVNYLLLNDQVQTMNYIGMTESKSIFSSGSFHSSSIYMGTNKVFIPFEKNAKLYMTYYLCYKANSAKKNKIKPVIDWCLSYFEEYNKVW